MFDLFERFVALPTVTHFLIGTMLAVHYAIAPRLGMWAFSVLSLPSTLAHELGHWFVALVLGARPSFPNIIPKREGSTWALGSVRVSPNILTRIPIALAPFALLPLGIWYAVAHSDALGWWYLVHIWISGTLIAASLPSRQDWLVALPAIICAVVGYLVLRKLQLD
ncbi:MAG: hypothetical protein Q8P42_06260 [Gallionella sp.]|nr:hypothetical protein [Gallionella sp.]